MATLCKEIRIDARVEQVWDAVRDYGALHKKVAPGLVTDTVLESRDRIVTFASGLVLRERIVAVEDESRRLVWSILGAPFDHHNASLQVIQERGSSRVIWVADLLPDDLKDMVAGIMDQGLALMKRTVEAQAAKRPVFSSEAAPLIHHISLFVRDLEASTRFYVEGLGLTVRRGFSDILAAERLRFGLASLFLQADGGSYLELHPAAEGSPMPASGFPMNHFALQVADVDAAYSQALGAGAKQSAIALPDRTWDGKPLSVSMEGPDPEAIRMAFVIGLDGELIELYQVKSLPDEA